jgi:hypothetical protein
VVFSKTAVKLLGAEVFGAAAQHFNAICDCFLVSSCMQIDESGAEEYGSDQFFKYAGAIEEAEKRQFETDEQFRELLLKLDVSYVSFKSRLISQLFLLLLF